MTKNILLALLFLAPLSAAVAAEPVWTCGQARAPLSVEDWSRAHLGAGLDKIPLFLNEWVRESADANGDGVVAADEQNRVLCEFARALGRETGAAGALVGPDGRIDWTAHLAGDDVVGGYELRFALSLIAAEWNARLLAATPLTGVDPAAVKALLDSGAWAVSERDMSAQEDLLGRDRTRAGQLQKQLGLAYILSELKAKGGAEFPALLSLYLEIALPQRNMPYLQSVNAANRELTVAFNQVTVTQVGVPGAHRYYLLHGTPVRLRAGQKAVWYQPGQQTTFMLTEAGAYPDSAPAVKLLRRKLARICAKSAAAYDLRAVLASLPLDGEALRARLQEVIDGLADDFLVDAPKVVVAERLENGATAYLDSAAGTISFSRELIDAVAREVPLADRNRHVVYLALQEFLHSVQRGLPDYEMNQRLYNAPHWAHTLFGDVGYREYYLGQPVERDAQDLAGRFVRGLDDGCASLD